MLTCLVAEHGTPAAPPRGASTAWVSRHQLRTASLHCLPRKPALPAPLPTCEPAPPLICSSYLRWCRWALSS